jgi:transcriptional regulator with XRE-family HTH domain
MTLSSISNRKIVKADILSRKIHLMGKHQLGELLDEAKERGFSLRRIQERTQGRLTASTMSGWRKADRVNLQIESIQELADAIGVSPTEVFLASIGRRRTAERKDESLREILEGFNGLLKEIDQSRATVATLKRQVQERLARDK